MAEWIIAPNRKLGVPVMGTGSSNLPPAANFMERVLRWFKSMLYEKKKSEKVVNDSVSLNESSSVHILEYQNQLHCKLHENYSGATPPINNCNICWEIYSQKCKQ